MPANASPWTTSSSGTSRCIPRPFHPGEMTVFQAIVLGVVQGLSEFLPVSSSAHLALVPWLFGWPDPGLAFDVALHLGTLGAVLWFFRAEWAALLRSALEIVRTRRVATPEQKRVVFLILATIPGGIAGI